MTVSLQHASQRGVQVRALTDRLKQFGLAHSADGTGNQARSPGAPDLPSSLEARLAEAALHRTVSGASHPVAASLLLTRSRIWM